MSPRGGAGRPRRLRGQFTRQDAVRPGLAVYRNLSARGPSRRYHRQQQRRGSWKDIFGCGMGGSWGSLLGWIPNGEPDLDDPDLVNRIF